MPTKRMEQLLALQAEQPGDAFLLYAIAKEYEGLEDYPQALERYREVLRVDPRYVGAFYHLGKLHEILEDYPAALHTYQQGIDLAQELGDLHALAELKTAKLNLELEL